MKCATCDHTEFKKELCERCGKEIWICKRCFQTHFPEGVEDKEDKRDILISDLSQRLHQCEEEKHKLMMKED